MPSIAVECGIPLGNGLSFVGTNAEDKPAISARAFVLQLHRLTTTGLRHAHSGADLRFSNHRNPFSKIPLPEQIEKPPPQATKLQFGGGFSGGLFAGNSAQALPRADQNLPDSVRESPG